jgi:phosphate-selective porin OprO/OprP
MLLLLVAPTLQAQSSQKTPRQADAPGLSDPPRQFATGMGMRELLFDQEIPLVGGAWGLEAFFDTPLNDEPAGAKATLRRSKLSYVRRLGTHLSLRATGDYTPGGGLEFSSSYLSWTGWDHYRLRVGITSPPFSLESMSASAGLTFMERALPVFAISERKSGGIDLLQRKGDHSLNAKLILFNVDRDDLREAGQGVVVHYGFVPSAKGEKRGLHVGASLSYRWNATESGSQFRSRPEVATVNDYYVDTGRITDADRVSRLSLEASRVHGRFSWQAELLGLRIDRDHAQALNFHGAYAFASWFLNGGSRVYDQADGAFKPVRVDKPVGKGGWGSFEIAARASHVDLTDREVVGGRQSNVSLGLNWYVNNRWRVMADVVKVLDVDRPGSAFDGAKPMILSLRLQLVLR